MRPRIVYSLSVCWFRASWEDVLYYEYFQEVQIIFLKLSHYH